MWERPPLGAPLTGKQESGGDEVKDFLGKGHHEAARQGEEPLRALGRIVALEGETNLHHAPAQKDQADGADQGKDEGGEVVDHTQRIAGGEGCGGKTAGVVGLSFFLGFFFKIKEFRVFFRSIPPVQCVLLWL